MLSIPLNQITKNVNSVQSMTAIMHNSIPVITTELLAGVYGTDVVRIRQNHARNTDRFYEGKHFFIIKGKELQEFKNRVSLSYSVDSNKLTESQPVELVGKRARSLTLWTERGAARHAKMLDTDQAWNVFEKLEDFYFNQKESVEVKPKTRRSTASQLTPLRQTAERLITTGLGRIYPDIWKLVHEHFDVKHITQLEPTQIAEAIEFLNVLEGEYLGKEDLPTPELKQQITDDEIITLCWSWKYLSFCCAYMSDVYPILKAAEHRLAGKFHSMTEDGFRSAREVQSILQRLSADLEPNTFNNSRIFRNLRQGFLPLP
ncbi:ORF6N domain-containing protein [Xenorhabdus bovienii]|uniref:ORF6N domain-containing protein n=1 Tax=Xenorhabdus bovienii TaxID=40576 RepID=UPI00237CB81A|nr:ORF6N domain-containing protein [Xenorhabdus bovienii]